MYLVKPKLIYSLIFSILLCFSALSGCSFNSSSKSDGLITINGQEISAEEYLIYLNEAVRNFEEIGGEDIWETDFDGKSAFDTAKESALTSLKTVKLTVLKSEANGVSLNEDELETSQTEAQSYFEKYSSLASINTVKKVMEEKALYNKTRQKILSEYTVNMSGFNEFLNDFKEELTSVTYSVIYTGSMENAQEIINKASNGVGFDELMAEYANNDNIHNLTDVLSDLSNIIGGSDKVKEGEAAGPIETDKGYAVYYFKAVDSIPDDEIQLSANEQYVEREKSKVFDSLLASWEKDAEIKINSEIWNTITKDSIDIE